jgi:heme-degrading monooxygenase HmoA
MFGGQKNCNRANNERTKNPTMFVLHVDIVLKPNTWEILSRTYIDRFMPAISTQPGYVSAILLRPVEKGEFDTRLVIEFESHEKQQAWVATGLHQQVWPEMEASIKKYAVHSFEGQ